MKTISTLTISLILFSSNVIAQCATGVNTGGGNCVPPDAPGMPGYENAPSEQQGPAAILEGRWGALVFGMDKTASGSVVGFPTKIGAINAATEKCRLQGAKVCELQTAYYNQCIAVAWGNESHTINSAAGELEARSRALTSCESITGGCKVVYTACSYPERVN